MNDRTNPTGFGMVPTYLRGHLTHSELAVYVALTWRMGSNGAVFPSHSTIASDAGMGEKTARRALQTLRDKGLVEWTNRARPDGGQTSNVYTINLTPPVGHYDRPPRSQGPTPPVTMTDEVDTSDLYTGKEDAPLAARNGVPSVNPTKSGPRTARTSVEELTEELDSDQDALGFIAGAWADGTQHLVETAIDRIMLEGVKDPLGWLTVALQYMSPVRRAARLVQLAELL